MKLRRRQSRCQPLSLSLSLSLSFSLSVSLCLSLSLSLSLSPSPSFTLSLPLAPPLHYYSCRMSKISSCLTFQPVQRIQQKPIVAGHNRRTAPKYHTRPPPPPRPRPFPLCVPLNHISSNLGHSGPILQLQLNTVQHNYRGRRMRGAWLKEVFLSAGEQGCLSFFYAPPSALAKHFPRHPRREPSSGLQYAIGVLKYHTRPPFGVWTPICILES